MRQGLSRRAFLQASAGSVGLLSAHTALGDAALPKEPDTKPNIVFIFSDQQHWRALGCQDPFFDTPHLDQLATEGVLFERAFCTTPQCSPSRASMLTGLYPSKTGVWGNVGAAGGEPLRQETLAPALQQAGYRTGYFGKWHLGHESEAVAGWDEKALGVSDSVVTAKGLEFLKTAGEKQPFALFLSYTNPHDIYFFKQHAFDPEAEDIPLPDSWERETFEGKPAVQKQFMTEDQGTEIWNDPRAEWERYRDCYREKTRLLDAEVGKVLSELQRRGLWENTIIVFTSDHGDMDTNHRLIYKGPFMYEQMMRVPLIVRMPKGLGGTAGERRVADFDVVHVDFAPTLLELAGAERVACDGISFAPTLLGRGEQRKRDFVVSEYYSKQLWVNPIRMIRTAEFKYTRYMPQGEELYHLDSDPEELNNLVGDPEHADTLAAMRRRLDQWVAENHDPFFTLEATTREGRELG